MDEKIKPVVRFVSDLSCGGGGWCVGVMREANSTDEDPDEWYVKYADHQQSIDALRAEVDRLKDENGAYSQQKLQALGKFWEAKARAERAEAEAEVLRADAERYRAMRDEFLWSMVSDTERTDLTLHMPGVSLAAIGPNSDDFDAAIDAARKGAE